MYLDLIANKKNNKEKLFSLLIDPEKYNSNSLVETIKIASDCKADFIFVGGSLISNTLDETIHIIKNECQIPVILFPGSYLQISNKADGILFISLISGRNPDLLIGNHVIASPLLKNSNLEVLPTGYILIKGDNITSVEYMSNTIPIPSDKIELVTATAQAGEMLGLKLIYLEAGSGAGKPINQDIISEVSNNINLPLIVGGGIRHVENIKKILHAGADMIVVGNAVENNKSILKELIIATKSI